MGLRIFKVNPEGSSIPVTWGIVGGLIVLGSLFILLSFPENIVLVVVSLILLGIFSVFAIVFPLVRLWKNRDSAGISKIALTFVSVVVLLILFARGWRLLLGVLAPVIFESQSFLMKLFAFFEK